MIFRHKSRPKGPASFSIVNFTYLSLPLRGSLDSLHLSAHLLKAGLDFLLDSVNLLRNAGMRACIRSSAAGHAFRLLCPSIFLKNAHLNAVCMERRPTARFAELNGRDAERAATLAYDRFELFPS
jgi:hypothetical protein